MLRIVAEDHQRCTGSLLNRTESSLYPCFGPLVSYELESSASRVRLLVIHRKNKFGLPSAAVDQPNERVHCSIRGERQRPKW
jgi:hypothetical protein